MAWSVTAKHNLNDLASSSSSETSSSAALTGGGSLLLCGQGNLQDDVGAGVDPVFTDPVGGSLSFTAIATATGNWFYSGFPGANEVGAKAWRAAVASSVSSFTFTVAEGSSVNAFMQFSAAEITGHDTSNPIVQSKTNGATLGAVTDSGSGTVTLDSTPTVGNLLWCIIISIGSGAGAPSIPHVGSGRDFTSIFAGTAAIRTAYREVVSGDSATITCADLGQGVGNYAMIGVEVRAAAGAANTPWMRLPRRDRPSWVARGDARSGRSR